MSPISATRILVTGAFGYVGGRLVRHLAGSGARVVLGSRAARAVPPSLPDATSRAMDFGDAESLRDACAGCDTVVHLAGANAQASATDPAFAFEANAVATARLATAAKAANVRRFLYLSTAHVYGSPLTGRIDEQTCPRGLHPYAASHRAGEDAVLFARPKLEVAAIRLSNAFGAPADAEADCWMLLVNDLCRQAVIARRLELKTSGLQRRDFVTLADATAAIAHLASVPAAALGDGIVNVGGAWAPTVREMAERIAAACPRVLGHAVTLDAPAPAAGETAAPLDYSIDRLRATGFVPRADIDAEIDATLRFCAAHAATGATS